MKVMTIVGTRPEIIRLSRVIVALERHTQHILVHTGQNYDYELIRSFSMSWSCGRQATFWRRRGKTPRRPSGSSSPKWMRFWPLKIPMQF